MLGELNLVLFLTASLALIIAPGPDNILVLTRGVAQGRGAALVSAAGGAALQLLALGLTFALLTWMLFSVLGYFSGGLGNWLRSRPGYANVLRWLTGGILVGLGLRLAFSDRR